MIRGKHVSRTMDSLVNEARFLASKGVKELILIAQDLTYYGIDIYGKRKLPELVEKLTSVSGIEWIRLHYAYPAGFPWELVNVISKYDKICNYLDIPLQHINDRILKSMKRGLDGTNTRKFVEKIRDSLPGVTFRTTLIAGYPGETDKEFQELYDFVKESRFDRLGVFTYSPEEGTSAYALKDDVPAKIKQNRLEKLMELQQNISLENNIKKTGKVFKVLIDKRENDFFVGRTECDSPEVDQEVLIHAGKKSIETGQFYNVKITKADFFDLYGEIEE
jgi:ribosomal protein S12 methylthiotransferase